MDAVICMSRTPCLLAMIRSKINLFHEFILKTTFLFQVELEVTLDSEGRDRVFRVTIKWVAQVKC